MSSRWDCCGIKFGHLIPQQILRHAPARITLRADGLLLNQDRRLDSATILRRGVGWRARTI
jgi:hypothetical protein